MKNKTPFKINLSNTIKLQPVYLFAALNMLMFLWVSLPASSQPGWTAAPEIVERLSSARAEFNYYEEKVPPYVLPELLFTSKGKKISNKNTWNKVRRPELLDLFASQVYGRVPGTPYEQRIEVIKTDPSAMNGAATLKLVDITISANGQSLTIHLGLFLPNSAKGPVPAFLLICNRPPENIDFTREKKSEFWPAEEVIARGYAIAAFYNADVDPDRHDGFQDGIHGILDQVRDDESWGTIAAWAWGASRCLDYLVTNERVAAGKVAVVGHSRGGKTALWAAAADQRFGMAVSNEAGCGGSSLARRRYGETVARINTSFPHWFCGNYKKHGLNIDAMPVDQHMLMALIAPRALYVAAADEDLWADPKGQYLALWHSLPAFQLWDKNTNLPGFVPPLNQPVRSGPVAFHIRDGAHNLLLRDWNFFMDHADQVFKNN